MALRALDPHLWCVDHTFAVGALHMNLRTSVLRVGDGLVLHSPGPLESDDAAAIEAIGPVVGIVAPNKFHHLFVGPAKERFPGARVFAAPGLREKQPRLPVDGVLPDVPAAWLDDVDLHVVDGCPMMNEVAVLHHRSRTLFLADVAFNLNDIPHTPTRWAMRLNGANGFGPSRLMRWVVTRDAEALAGSIGLLLTWDFDRIVVCHGDVVETGGRDALRAAFAYLGV